MIFCLNCGNLFKNSGFECPDCGRGPSMRNDILLFAPEKMAGDGTDLKYDYQTLYESEANHFWFRIRNRLIVWALSRFFPRKNRFLEVGCGTGYVISGIKKVFPMMDVSGADLLIEGLYFVRQRQPKIDLFQIDARRMPFRDEFDLIGAFDVIEHIEDDESVLKQIYLALKPGGGLLLTVPQHPFLYSEMDRLSFHKRRYTRKEIEIKLKRAGFKPLLLTSFMSITLPLLLVSRFIRSKKQWEADPTSEIRINKSASRLLERLLYLEEIAIRRGLHPPWGGSLLVAARK